jgi:hypothetical protein
MNFILFTAIAPSPLADQLRVHGHVVLEALAISEVLALAEEHGNAQILIVADVDEERAK